MRLILVAVAIVVVVAVGAFLVFEVFETGSEDASEPIPAASPTSFRLEGTVSMEFSLLDVHGCEDVLLTDLPRPETEEEVDATIRHQEAQGEVELVMDRTVSIFDAEADEHLATEETGTEISTAEQESAEAEEGEVACVASTSFSTVLSPVESYRFVVRGIAGEPESVDYEDLQANGFRCDLFVDPSGRLVEDAPCGIDG